MALFISAAGKLSSICRNTYDWIGAETLSLIRKIETVGDQPYPRGVFPLLCWLLCFAKFEETAQIEELLTCDVGVY